MINEKCRPNGPSVTWQLVKKLENAILQGELYECGYIFSTREIMRRYNVSDKTAQRAVGILQQYEMLELDQGKGLKIAHGTKDFIRRYRTQKLHEDLTKIIEDGEILKLTRGELDEMIDKLTSQP